MIETTKFFKISHQMKRTALILAVVWTVVILLALGWNLFTEYKHTLEMAHIQANLSFEKDLVYRRWSADHGGTYVPATEETPPNPYLSHLENRDIKTKSGRELTLVNPAYMTRQVHELGKEQYGHLGHITSLNPIRPENAPDEWETKALRSFERGMAEVGELVKIEDTDYYRLMRPMVTETSCLKCHADHGYKEGDLRGGISVSVPMKPLWKIMSEHISTLILGYGFIWLLGLSGIGLGTRQLGKRIQEREKAENERAESESKYRLLVENTETGFVAVDDTGIVIEANEPYIRMVGFENAEDIIGRSVIEWTAPESKAENAAAVALCAKQGHIQDFETIYLRVDGTRINILINATMHETNSGKRLNAFCRDITKRKQAEEKIKGQARLLDLIFKHSLDSIILLDKDYNFIRVSESYAKACQRDSSEFPGHNHFEFYPSNFKDEADEVKKGKYIYQKSARPFIFPDHPEWGTTYWDLGLVPILDEEGEIEFFLFTLKDVTKRKRAEDALYDSNQLKELLLDVITHDLKNPAAAIKGFSEIILEDDPDNEIVGYIHQGSDSLLKVFDNALILSQVSVGDEIIKEEIDLVKIIKLVVEEFLPKIESSGLALQIDLPEVLMINANQIIIEVFRNYINNSIKYAKAGKKIIIDVDTKDDVIIVNVKDFGKSIQKEDYRNIFTRKYQIEKGHGRGLGLAIVKRIAEAHNAEVGVKPNKPTGNIFYLKIPKKLS